MKNVIVFVEYSMEKVHSIIVITHKNIFHDHESKKKKKDFYNTKIIQ